jgi:uncharacterized membrane protein HdeD (DUF308 family)
MDLMLGRIWWVLALRGIVAIIFGVIALIWPGLTLRALVITFGAFALIDGIFTTGIGIASYGQRQRWWAILLEGAAGIVIGVLSLVRPDTAALAFVYVCATWLLLRGVLAVIGAFQIRKVIHGEWMLALSGVVSIALGLLLIASPATGALSLTLLAGSYAVLLGILLLALALRLRKVAQEERSPEMSRAVGTEHS